MFPKSFNLQPVKISDTTLAVSIVIERQCERKIENHKHTHYPRALMDLVFTIPSLTIVTFMYLGFAMVFFFKMDNSCTTS